jgi:hypothetical protein
MESYNSQPLILKSEKTTLCHIKDDDFEEKTKPKHCRSPSVISSGGFLEGLINRSSARSRSSDFQKGGARIEIEPQKAPR